MEDTDIEEELPRDDEDKRQNVLFRYFPASATDKDLLEFFGVFGDVQKLNSYTNETTDEHLKQGIVTFSDPYSALKAESIDGADILGQNISIIRIGSKNISNNQLMTKDSDKQETHPSHLGIIVENLHPYISEEQVVAIFRKCGHITNIMVERVWDDNNNDTNTDTEQSQQQLQQQQLPRDVQSVRNMWIWMMGPSSSVAYIAFTDEESVQVALQLRGEVLCGFPMKIRGLWEVIQQDNEHEGIQSEVTESGLVELQQRVQLAMALELVRRGKTEARLLLGQHDKRTDVARAKMRLEQLQSLRADQKKRISDLELQITKEKKDIEFVKKKMREIERSKERGRGRGRSHERWRKKDHRRHKVSISESNSISISDREEYSEDGYSNDEDDSNNRRGRRKKKQSSSEDRNRRRRSKDRNDDNEDDEEEEDKSNSEQEQEKEQEEEQEEEDDDDDERGKHKISKETNRKKTNIHMNKDDIDDDDQDEEQVKISKKRKQKSRKEKRSNANKEKDENESGE
ncbi:MAG: hypothetical protein EZS28_012179 [Streblomastix strix]|uniref:RRM domain-containing protein n=1 Tax=Streblomastix strix TaxID=222440 RepID=A0A5J4WCL1_9EUKA|nr:MAG: hypothetical protein EZS28_012179 [Streblomastix strix]